MVFTNERWSAQNLITRNGEHDIYSLYMKHTIFIHEKWGIQHLLWKDAIHCIY